MKNSRGGSDGRSFFKPFFYIRENVFQSFCTNFLSQFFCQNFSLSFPDHNPESRSMCNLHSCYTFCTGVALELHRTQPIRIEQFFHVYYYSGNPTLLFSIIFPHFYFIDFQFMLKNPFWHKFLYGSLVSEAKTVHCFI